MKKNLIKIVATTILSSLVFSSSVFASDQKFLSAKSEPNESYVTTSISYSKKDYYNEMVKENIISQAKVDEIRKYINEQFNEAQPFVIQESESGVIIIESANTNNLYNELVEKKIITKEEASKIKAFEDKKISEEIEKETDERIKRYIDEKIFSKEKAEAVKIELINFNPESFINEHLNDPNAENKFYFDVEKEITKDSEAIIKKVNEAVFSSTESSNSLENELLPFDIQNLVDKKIISEDEGNKMIASDIKFYQIQFENDISKVLKKMVSEKTITNEKANEAINLIKKMSTSDLSRADSNLLSKPFSYLVTEKVFTEQELNSFISNLPMINVTITR